MAETKFNIGVFGSSAGEMADIVPKATQLGDVLGEHADEVVVITGACAGLPYEAASRAAAGGCEVWGYSDRQDFAGLQAKYPNDDLSIYSKLIYIPADYEFADNERVCFKYRNVTSTAVCDAGIIISGRWGSLNEFTNLVDMRKLVGVLTDTGGVADELEQLSQRISKEGQGEVIFNNNPAELVAQLLQRLRA